MIDLLQALAILTLIVSHFILIGRVRHIERRLGILPKGRKA